MNTPGGHNSPRAKRLRQLRIASGFGGHGGMKRFAAHLEIEYTRYANFERGLPISHEVEDLLHEKVPGFSLDWLRYGREDGLSVNMLSRLREASEKLKTTAA